MSFIKLTLATLCVVIVFPCVVDAQVDDLQLPTGRAISPAGKTIAFYGRPVDVELGPQAKILYVKDRNHLRAIDAESFEMIDSIEAAGGASLFGIEVDKNGHVYYSNAKDSVHVFQLDENRKLRLLNSIKLEDDSFPCGVCLSADEKQLYVCLSKKNKLAIVNLETQKTITAIDVGVAPFDVVKIANQLIVSNIGGRRAKDGDKTAPSADTETVVDDRGIANTGTISIISISQRKLVKDIAVGLHPSALLIDGKNAFVCNTNQDSISRFDVASGSANTFDVKPDEKLPFGSMPSSLAWLPDQKHLLITLAGNNAISVLKKTDSGELGIGREYPNGMVSRITCSQRQVYFRWKY